jgi:N-methylhydantoinase A
MGDVKPQQAIPNFRIGVDTGGTFTDIIGLQNGEVRSWKLSSTPGRFEQAVLQGALHVSQREAAQLIHSTTVATNALLERKGSRCALVTTRGFRDVLEIGRQTRPDLYALYPKKPLPLIPAENRYEISERVNARGEVLIPLNEEDVLEVIQVLKKENIESVAVVFLFSFLVPDHERRVGEMLRDAGFKVSLSQDVLPEFREVERSSTTVANAYVQPVMMDYLDRLQDAGEKQKTGNLQLVQSNGGTLSPQQAGREAVHTLLSGPAAGIQGVLQVAKAGDPDQNLKLITFDMGGTSTDVALIDGRPQISTEMKLGDFPIGVPMFNIHTVGAGGGSLARVDAGGALQVGPESAGADPGPACYGNGGGATVTDAHVVLGHIRPENFLQGRMKLHRDASEKVMTDLGERMGGLTKEEAARGVLQIANLHMENAIRVISVQKGYDPAEFTLVGFGGAGGLHSFALAEALGISRVLVPCHPGVLSALGAASASVRQECGITVMQEWGPGSGEILANEIRELTGQVMHRFVEEGFGDGEPEIRVACDMRYCGQSHELRVEVNPDEVDKVREAFDAEHMRQYGYCDREGAVQVVTVRVSGEWAAPEMRLPTIPERLKGENVPESPTGWIRRDMLLQGDVLRGPLLVVEDFHTVVLPRGWELRVDRIGNLIGTRVEE